ncbi:hypothetical protein ACFXO9_26630 [Nocardia tengchongensis]|uniref:hypothetical protein n=1 Tax=Nocardia tengchongensis TaxID=2055889 RepID=UPI00369CD9D9
MVIASAAALVRWIENALPPVDSTAFGPWLAEAPEPQALTALVTVHVESPALPTQSITVALSAHPTTGDHPAP